MLPFFLTGVALGLSAGLSPGPLLALVVSETLMHGVRGGVKVALAPLLTDLPIVLAALFLMSRIGSMERVVGGIYLTGGVYLAWLAWEGLAFRGADLDRAYSPDRSLQKGVTANFLNPSPYVFWLAIGAPTVMEAARTGMLASALFIAGFYVCLVGSKVLLAWLVGRSRFLLQSKNYIYTIKILGLVLAFFACLFLYQGSGKIWGFGG